MPELPVREAPKDRLKEITDSIERGIQELFDSDRYKQYLQTMSRFHNYSLNNVMLISMQRPDATHVAGYGKWQTAFSRHVKKGEKGIKIIAPTPYKKKVEEMLIDPDTKQPLRGPDGELLKQEVEVVIPRFRAVTVFDVSQTDGKPLPTLSQNLTASVQNYEVMMEALRRTSPVPISIEPIHDGSDGFYSHASRSITVKEGMSESQTVSTTIHEIAHAKLHSRPDVQLDHTAPRYQLAEIMGQEVLFSNGRIDRENLPDGLYCYDLREGDSGYAAIMFIRCEALLEAESALGEYITTVRDRVMKMHTAVGACIENLGDDNVTMKAIELERTLRCMSQELDVAEGLYGRLRRCAPGVRPKYDSL